MKINMKIKILIFISKSSLIMQRRAAYVVNNEDLGLGRTMGPTKFDYLTLSTIVWFTNFAIIVIYDRLYLQC